MTQKFIVTEVYETTTRYLVDAENEADALKAEKYDAVVQEMVEQTKRVKRAELHSSLQKASAIVDQNGNKVV